MLPLLLHHQGPRESDAVADVNSLAVAVCSEEGAVDSGEDREGRRGSAARRASRTRTVALSRTLCATASTLSAVAAHGHWAVVSMSSLRCCLQKQCHATVAAALQWRGCWPISSEFLSAAETCLPIDAHRSPTAPHLT